MLDYTTTYNGGTEDSKTVTDLAKKSYTNYVGNTKGEEIADYQLTYKGESGSETVSSTNVYFYLSAHKRASDSGVTADDAMSASASYKGDKSAAVYTDKTDLRTRTHYKG